MTQSDLRTLLDYHYWARDRLLTAVDALTPEQFTRDMGSSFRSVRDTLAHIVGAETAWLARWQGHSPTALLPPDQFPDVAAVRKVWTSLEGQVRSFLDDLGEEGVARVFEYKMLSGAPGASPFWQMLQHVVNHASYHRGQVVTMLRQLGAPPPKSLDLIAFYRENSS
jgi:uncharacterized damage-inducible protein DinB